MKNEMTIEDAKRESEKMRKEVPFEHFLSRVRKQFFERMKDYDRDEIENYFRESVKDVRQDYMDASSVKRLMSNYSDKNALKKDSTISDVVNSLEMCF